LQIIFTNSFIDLIEPTFFLGFNFWWSLHLRGFIYSTFNYH